MRVFTAYEKPGPAGPGADSDVVLVEEGGSFKAMFLPLIWPLFHRMWIILAAQFLIIVAFILLSTLSEDAGLVMLVAAGAASVMMGLNANDLRRWSLRQRGYVFTGIVAGHDVAEAEQRLFTALGPHIYLS